MASFKKSKRSDNKRCLFRSNERYFYREFDSIFLPRSSPKYSRTTIRAYFLLYFRHEAYYARWSSHNWSLGRVCGHGHFSSQGTRKLTPLVSQAHVSKKTVVIVRFFLRRDLGTPVGSISLLSMYVLVMFVENNQILPWHSFWFGWSVGNCILYRFQDVYRSWLPVELKHEIVFPAALIKHHYSRGQKVKHGDILIYETDHHYLRRIPHRRNKWFTDKFDKKNLWS